MCFCVAFNHGSELEALFGRNFFRMDYFSKRAALLYVCAEGRYKCKHSNLNKLIIMKYFAISWNKIVILAVKQNGRENDECLRVYTLFDDGCCVLKTRKLAIRPQRRLISIATNFTSSQ